MLSGHKNSKKQGDVGMGVAIGWFASQGTTVCIPLTDSQDYDLVVEIDGSLKKVQVKTTRCIRAGYYQCNLKVCGGNKSGTTTKLFDSSFVDYLFAVTGDNSKYLIPTTAITATSSISLGLNYKQYLLQ